MEDADFSPKSRRSPLRSHIDSSADMIWSIFSASTMTPPSRNSKGWWCGALWGWNSSLHAIPLHFNPKQDQILSYFQSLWRLCGIIDFRTRQWCPVARVAAVCHGVERTKSYRFPVPILCSSFHLRFIETLMETTRSWSLESSACMSSSSYFQALGKLT